MIKRILSSPSGVAAVVSLFALGVYLKTLAPSVNFIDSGELAAVASTLGIAHPTGYPLFTLLGWVFSKLPIASEEIVRLNMMSAFFCAAGTFLFFHLTHDVLRMLKNPVSRQRRDDDSKATLLVASACAVLILAFSETYWSTALSVEVYSLHVFFLSLVTLSFLRANSPELDSTNEGVAGERRGWWLLFALSLGFSFANHMTTVLLAPGFLFFYFVKQGFNAQSWKRIGFLAVPFLAGLSVYLYLPIRAAQSPLFNWGNPTTLERFLWHLTGKQYRVWIFSSTEATSRQFNYFLESIPGEFAYVGLLLGALGIVSLFRSNRHLAWTFLLLFVGCVVYSINYDIHDIDSYFLLAYLVVALCAGAGILMLLQRFGRNANAAFVALGICLFPLFFNYNHVDESKNYLVEDYTMNMFKSLPSNAVILSYQWDYWVSASYYYQYVKGMRTDIAVVDKELLRRSWYLDELRVRHPWLIENSKNEVAAFSEELFKFEHDIPYNPSVIQDRFVQLIRSMIDRTLAERPVYVTHEVEPEFTQGFQKVPDGLAFRIFKDNAFHATDFPVYQYKPFTRSGRLEVMFPRFYGASLSARGAYYYRAGDVEEAARAFESAIQYDPSSIEAQRGLQTVRAPK
ncbi:MAG: protein O-mannosyl-transferase family [Bacteroidota bacterium]